MKLHDQYTELCELFAVAAKQGAHGVEKPEHEEELCNEA